MSNDKPVELKPGWLAEDVAKATARAAEWTTPAMTAKRLAEIARAITPYPGKELFAYIDALHARVTALERERDEARAKALEEAAAVVNRFVISSALSDKVSGIVYNMIVHRDEKIAAAIRSLKDTAG